MMPGRAIQSSRQWHHAVCQFAKTHKTSSALSPFYRYRAVVYGRSFSKEKRATYLAVAYAYTIESVISHIESNKADLSLKGSFSWCSFSFACLMLSKTCTLPCSVYISIYGSHMPTPEKASITNSREQPAYCKITTCIYIVDATISTIMITLRSIGGSRGKQNMYSSDKARLRYRFESLSTAPPLSDCGQILFRSRANIKNIDAVYGYLWHVCTRRAHDEWCGTN